MSVADQARIKKVIKEYLSEFHFDSKEGLLYALYKELACVTDPSIREFDVIRKWVDTDEGQSFIDL